MEPKGSSPHPQEPAACPDREQARRPKSVLCASNGLFKSLLGLVTLLNEEEREMSANGRGHYTRSCFSSSVLLSAECVEAVQETSAQPC
jgi:hypothetical protein